jgi:hypothetical protein
MPVLLQPWCLSFSRNLQSFTAQAVASLTPPAPDALAQAIAADLKAWESSLADKTRYQNHQEAIERALERRQREYNQTKDRHAEFPASAELQNKYRRRDDEDRRKLEDAAGKNNQNLHRVRDNLSRIIANAASMAAAANPPPNKDSESQIPAVKIALNQHKDDTKKDIADLRKALGDQQSSSASMIAELQTQFQKQLDEHKADNAANQAQVVKAALEAQRLELSKGREEFAASEALLRTEVGSLRSENSSLRSEVATLTQKLSEIVDQGKQRDQQIQELQTLVSSQGEKLFSIDLTEWERVNDGMLIELPRLQATVEGLCRTQQQPPSPSVATNSIDMSAVDTKLGVLQAECRQMLHEHEDKLGTIVTKALTQIAGWVDELRAEDDRLRRELQEHSATATCLSTLSARARAVPSSESRSASPGQRPPAPGSGAAIVAGDVSSSTAMIERIGKVERAVSYYGQRIAHTEQRFVDLEQRVAKRVDALSHQTVVLEARWNNLSTKELAERIIGQLEQIYAPSKVINDIVLLNEHAQATKTKLADYETCINSIKQELAEVKTAVGEGKKAEQARKSEETEEQSVEVQGDRAAKKRKLREPHNADRVGDEQLRKRMGAGINGRLANGH